MYTDEERGHERKYLEERLQELFENVSFTFSPSDPPNNNYFWAYTDRDNKMVHIAPMGWYSTLEEKEYPLSIERTKKRKVGLKKENGLTKAVLCSGWSYTFYSQMPLPTEQYHTFRERALAFKYLERVKESSFWERVKKFFGR